ncbi:MAG: AraC family transcriptional regulator [Bacteroidota bacterium]
MTLDLPILDLVAALLGGGAALLGLVVGGVLLIGRGPYATARRFLGGFLVAGGLTLLNELIFTLQLQRLSPHFWITPLLYTFALGPLLWFFIRHRLDPERQLQKRDLLHAILPGIQIAHEVVTGFGTIEMKSAYWQSAYGQTYGNLEIVIFVISFSAYLIASARRLRAEREASGSVGLWLLRLVRGCAVIVVVALVMESPFVAPFLFEAVGETTFAWLKLVEMMVYASLLYWVAFTGFVHTLHRQPEVAALPAQRERQETYGMTPDDLARHADRLRRFTEAERPHLDPDLTLGTLADRLALSDKELSYVLNEGLGTSYTDWVNGLRVQSACSLLADPIHADRTVLEIAMDAGFASKATFNRVFKAETGQTPTAFRAAPRRLTTS